MPRTNIQTIFFDLDHTLWDYEVNSRETLGELFQSHSLHSLLGCTLDEFLTAFREINQEFWDLYNNHKIDRDTIRNKRFKEIFQRFDTIADHLALEISEEYLTICPTKAHLFPHAIETLEYLKGEYPMHIITNGFNDVQSVKLESSRLSHYFDEVITSETAGFRKPAREIFTLACERAGAVEKESLMIGDNLKADIEGAMSANLQAMYFNPSRIPHSSTPHFEIFSLSEVPELL